MQARVIALENFAIDTRDRLMRIETRIRVCEVALCQRYFHAGCIEPLIPWLAAMRKKIRSFEQRAKAWASKLTKIFRRGNGKPFVHEQRLAMMCCRSGCCKAKCNISVALVHIHLSGSWRNLNKYVWIINTKLSHARYQSEPRERRKSTYSHHTSFGRDFSKGRFQSV